MVGAARRGTARPSGEEPGIVLGWAARLLVLPRPVRAVLPVALIAAVAALDIETGAEVSFSIFYLVPVVLAGAGVSRGAGRLTALACAAVWAYVDVSTGGGYSAGWIPFWNSAVRLGFFLLVNELVDALRATHARERALSRTDSLTGIANARVFDEHARRILAESRRSGRPFTLTYVDLDRFKQVNDREGHSEGDRVLRAVAGVLAARTRESDVVARLGGDEFAILMPDTSDAPARTSLERIAAALDAEVGARWGVGATLGAVTFSRPPGSVDDAVREADALMYRGKGEGRGRILTATWPSGVEER